MMKARYQEGMRGTARGWMIHHKSSYPEGIKSIVYQEVG